MVINDLKEINKTKGFYVRIRKDLSKSGKIYYDGFKINENSNEEISNSFFKFNAKNIAKSLKKGKSDKLISKIAEYRKDFFTTYKITEIKFEKSDFAQRYEEKYNGKLNEIKKKFDINYKKENIIEVKFDNIEQEFDLLKTLWNIDNEGKRTIENCFFKNLKLKYKIEGGNLSLELVKNKVPGLTSFYEEYTHLEMEKKYQHLFLLNIKNDVENGYLHQNVFGKKEIIPFEEEYYINYPGGRIDCIFYAVNDNLITDIYLIELKVDSKVLGGTNGIPTHLSDIDDIDDNVFYSTLLEYINERNQILNDKYIPYNYSEDFNKHFFVIVGRYKCSEKYIKKLVSDLNDEKSSLYKNVKINGKKKEPISQIAKRLRKKRS